ncbi:MAG: serine/threonine-protein kinase [Acidobacteriota bacterium]
MVERLDSLFDETLRRAVDAPDDRLDAILEACGDLEIRERVRRLVLAEPSLDSFLEPQFGPRRALSASLTTWRSPTLPLRQRLTRVAWATTLALSAISAFVCLRLLAQREPLDSIGLELFATGALVTLSLALALATRSPALTDRALLTTGSAYLLVATLSTAVFHAAHEIRIFGRIAPFGPHFVWIAFFPLVLPLSTRRTALLGFSAACAATAGLSATSAHLLGSAHLTLEHAAAPLAGMLLATLIAHSFDRLRSQIDDLRNLGSYRLVDKIGEGGMGEVWRAEHHLLARPAAIKLVRTELLGDGPGQRHAAVERFTREARTTASLTSLHTVELYDFGISDDGIAYLAMELLDGIDLSELVHRGGPQPAGRVVSVLRQACDSLGEAHARGLVHRDIKPANLMLCRRGRQVDVLKVLDFGIVALAPETADGELTRPGTLLGTPSFLAPEAHGGGAPDPRSDLYALGCVAYGLLTGRRVFEHTNRAQIIASHLRDRPKPPSQHGVTVPGDLEAVVLSCLEKDPAARPQSADALLETLDGCRNPRDWSDQRARAWWDSEIPGSLRDSRDASGRSTPRVG